MNAQERFTGLLDVPLTSRGIDEAKAAARMLAEAEFTFDTVCTSWLQRAQQTATIVLSELDLLHTPRGVAWELNERNYGALTGRTKSDVLAEYGRAQFTRWRRSLRGRPPALDPCAVRSLREQPGLQGMPPRALTPTESLADVVARVTEWWAVRITRKLLDGRDVLVVAHGNSLRALCFVLDGLSVAEVETLNLPTGHPLVYELDETLTPVHRGGRYLDPEAARAAARVVAQSGGT